jgi:hypothetical protein
LQCNDFVDKLALLKRTKNRRRRGLWTSLGIRGGLPPSACFDADDGDQRRGGGNAKWLQARMD